MQLYALINDDLRPLPFSGHVGEVYAALPLGVYTSFVTFERFKFLDLAVHLDRLEHSLVEMDLHYTLNRPGIRRAIDHLCHTVEPEAPNLRFRLDVLAAAPEQWGLANDEEAGRLLLAVSPFYGWPEKYYQEGVAVATVPALHRELPRAKTADFVLAREAATQNIADAYEYLLLDRNGYLLECSSSNFYAVREGAIWTAEEEILEGVTRRIVLKIVGLANLPLHLEPVALDAVPELEEAFLSSSSRGIMPVVRIDEQKVGSGRPGPITRQLIMDYNNYVAEAIRPAWPEQ